MEKRNYDANSLQSLLASSPQIPLNWLDEDAFTNEQTAFDFDFLLGLAQGASTKATPQDTEGFQEQEALCWAEIAIKIYRHLARNFPEYTDSFLDSEMALRVQMINKYSPEKNDPIRDSDDVFDYFFTRLPFSFEQTKDLSDRWQKALREHSNPFESLNKADILELRKIKNRLKVVEPLKWLLLRNEIVACDWHPIGRWLELKAMLP